MNKEYLEDILSILMLVILIDNKVYPEEVDTFANAVRKISTKIDPDILFTESMASDWFRANRADYKARLHQESSNAMIKTLIRKLEKFSGRKDVFYNMIRIAHSDKEYHGTEHSLIQQASHSWNIPYSVDKASIAT